MGPTERQAIAAMLRQQSRSHEPAMSEAMNDLANLLTCSDNERFYETLLEMRRSNIICLSVPSSEINVRCIADHRLANISDEDLALNLAATACNCALIAESNGVFDQFKVMLQTMEKHG